MGMEHGIVIRTVKLPPLTLPLQHRRRLVQDHRQVRGLWFPVSESQEQGETIIIHINIISTDTKSLRGK